MAEASANSTTVTDNRTPPRGVMPRGTQTWLMAGLALVILAIIVFTGRPAPAARSVTPTNTPQLAPSPDRLREYQDRLHALDERARQQAAAPALPSGAGNRPVYPEQAERAPAPDAIQQERIRREYDSLFAGNVVLSRRGDADRLVTGSAPTRPGRSAPPSGQIPSGPPSLDDVAAAVLRASGRGAQAAPVVQGTAMPAALPPSNESKLRPATGPILSTGPLHRVLEGTLIDTVLTNRLDGAT